MRTKVFSPSKSAIDFDSSPRRIHGRVLTGDSRTGRTNAPRSASFRPPPSRRSSEVGIASLGGLLLLFTFISAVGLWSTFRHLRAITERQVTLDRCTGAAVLRLRNNLQSLESSYRRIEAARLLTLSLLPTPAGLVALETFRKGMKLERTLEEGIQKKWKAEEAQWNLLPGIGCQIHNHPFRSPYPQFDFPLINPEWGIADVRTTPFQVQFKTRYALEASVARLTSGASLLRHSDKTWNAFWHR